MKKLLIISFIALSFFGCNSAEEEVEEEIAEQFFDVVYVTAASRILGSNTWISVNGDQRFQFLLPNEDLEETGSFTVAYNEFREPQLLTSNCSGGYEGSFVLRDTIDEIEEEDNSGYNPLDPYEEAENEDDFTETDEEIEEILTYIFGVSVTDRSFSEGCRSVSDTFNMRAIRFSTGDVVITDYAKQLEYYLTPEIIDNN